MQPHEPVATAESDDGDRRIEQARQQGTHQNPSVDTVPKTDHDDNSAAVSQLPSDEKGNEAYDDEEEEERSQNP